MVMRGDPDLDAAGVQVLEGMQLTRDQFIDVCILLGCDYCGTIRGGGPSLYCLSPCSQGLVWVICACHHLAADALPCFTLILTPTSAAARSWPMPCSMHCSVLWLVPPPQTLELELCPGAAL